MAVLTSEAFDASHVHPETVRFADAKPMRCMMRDVDNDGDADLLLHFKTQEESLDELSIEAELTGQISAVTYIWGKDTVNIVPKSS